jgi:cytochrome c
MDMELNKIFGAILTAGIIAYLSWFVSSLVYHPAHHDKPGYPIEVAGGDAGTAGPAAAAGPEPLDMSTADVARGAKLAAVCASCHTFGQGEPAKVGPNLAGIVGGSHAHMGSYPYSDAMKSHAGEKWDYEALNKFLWSPQKTIPGTKMTYAGMKKAEDRASLIKWLETQK